MPAVIETTVYQFDELSDSAKEQARDWFRLGRDSSDFEFVIDDFETICGLMGIDLKEESFQTMGGGTRSRPAVSYSVGYCQSDFAAFDATYRYAKGGAKKLKEYAPTDEVLHAIAETLQEVQSRNFYALRADVKYHHYYGLTVEVESEKDREVSSEDYETVKETMRKLARWLYNTLREEDEHQSSDEVVDDNIRANKYTFTESGERFG